MLKRLDLLLIMSVLVLGLAHIAFTPVLFKTFSIDALWFAGTGLSFVFLGLLHLIRRTSGSPISLILSLIASLAATAFSVLIVIKLPAPQAYLAVVINAMLSTTAALSIRSSGC
jgi:hypothetical protein